MTVAALTILGPLAALVAILLFRRAPAALALLGAGVEVVSAAVTLVRVAGGANFSAALPGLPGFPLRIVVEPLTAVLAVLVAVVSVLVMVYAVGYMEGARGRVRFFAKMSFFAAMMQTLVVAGDWVLLLAAWELIGLASYLLIGFSHEKGRTGSAATRAFLYTRTADLGLYVAVFVLISRSGTSEISGTFGVGGPAAFAAGILLLLAAAGKSAQVPLQGWLQDAMVAPTPVTAFLHSATLVAAGAILLIRTFPLLSPGVLLVVGLLGGVTAVATGVTAVAERDLKRLLAASTSSQYGFMLLALGAGFPAAALFHLAAHAAMKSALFAGSGIFQRARGSTSFSDLGGSGRERPLVFTAFTVAGLALAAVPPLAGYFSKDAIVAAAYESGYGFVLLPLALAGALLTGAYVARALRLLWRGEKRAEPVAGMRWMWAGLASLTVLAVFVGFLKGALSGLIGEEIPDELVTTVVGTAAAFLGLFLGWTFTADRLLGPLRAAAENGFRLAGGVDALVAKPALALAEAVRVADERGIDGVIFALVRGARDLGERVRALQSGLVHRELALAAGGMALLLVFLAVEAMRGL